MANGVKVKTGKNEYIVDPTGKDGAYTTIQAALDAANEAIRRG